MDDNTFQVTLDALTSDPAQQAKLREIRSETPLDEYRLMLVALPIAVGIFAAISPEKLIVSEFLDHCRVILPIHDRLGEVFSDRSGTLEDVQSTYMSGVAAILISGKAWV